MTRPGLTFYFLLSLVAQPLLAQTPKTTAEIALETTPSVVTLIAESSEGEEIRIGSGFVMEDGRVVTDAHVVAGASLVRILTSGGGRWGRARNARALDVEAGIAILPFNRDAGSPLRPQGLHLSEEPPKVGARVVVIGSARGLGGTVSEGILNAVTEKGSQQFLEITAPISLRSSGGPVLDDFGRVVGVAVASVKSGQSRTSAVPISVVASLAATSPGIFPFPEARLPNALLVDVAPPATEVPWLILGDSRVGSVSAFTSYLHTPTLSRQGSMVEARFRHEFIEPQVGQPPYLPDAWDATELVEAINCETYEAQYREVWYYKQGILVLSTILKTGVWYEAPPPNSIEYAEAREACFRAKGI